MGTTAGWDKGAAAAGGEGGPPTHSLQGWRRNPLSTPCKWTCEHGHSCSHQVARSGAPVWDPSGTRPLQQPQMCTALLSWVGQCRRWGSPGPGKEKRSLSHPPPNPPGSWEAGGNPRSAPLLALPLEPTAAGEVLLSLACSQPHLLSPSVLLWFSSWCWGKFLSLRVGPGLKATLPAQPGAPGPLGTPCKGGKFDFTG